MTNPVEIFETIKNDKRFFECVELVNVMAVQHNISAHEIAIMLKAYYNALDVYYSIIASDN